MCDGSSAWNYSLWNNNFYYQYLQQHAQMTKWVQQLHQNISPNLYSIPQNSHACHCSMQHTWPAPARNNHVAFENVPSQAAKEYVNEMVDEEDDLDFLDDEDEYSSEDEIVFNADAILAMRASKDVSEKEESEESFELIDSVKEELFEYVELNTFGRLETKIGSKVGPDVEGEFQNEKEQKRLMYGEKADSIAGLETTMAINFDHLCDIQQPHLWPVLPVLL